MYFKEVMMVACCQIASCIVEKILIYYSDYERDPEDNPADFFLDTIITNEMSLDVAEQEGNDKSNYRLK